MISYDRPRLALITGAGSGLGRALAVRLAADRWHTVLADINLHGCHETADLVAAAGGTTDCERLDVTSPEQWSDLVCRLRERFPRLDLLINNAGVAATGEIGRSSLEDWRWLLNVNLFGVLHGCHACRQWCESSPGAHIVNIASSAALVSFPGLGGYNASKAAVVALSETLYAELRRYRVGVTTVCPSFFSSQILDKAKFSNDLQRETAYQCMQNSSISADEIARAIVRAVARRETYLVLPRPERFRWLLKRLFPKTMLNLNASRYARFLRRAGRQDAAPQRQRRRHR